MISGVTVEIGGQARVLRMTTRAMLAIEQRLDKGVIEVIQGMEGGFKVTELFVILAECAEDGAGVGHEEAEALLDDLGVVRAGEVLGEVIEAAFPDAKDKAKNAKRAARSK